MSAPTTRFTLGLDLTTLGAKASVQRRATARTGEKVSLTDVAEYLDLAREAGVELVTVGESFRLEDTSRQDAWLDPAVLASRLGAEGHLTDGPAIAPALPAGFIDPVRLARAVAGIHARSGGNGGWQVPISTTAGGVHEEIRRVWAANKDANTGGRRPLLVTAPTDRATAVVAGRHSDVVRLRVSTIEEAREWRTAIRTAATQAGRNPDDVRVVVDAITVIGDDAASALFRADLLRDLGSQADTLTVAGTARGVAEELQAWSASGAVDGVVILPGSVPTDVVALATQLAPELRSLGVLEGDGVAEDLLPASAGLDAALDAALANWN